MAMAMALKALCAKKTLKLANENNQPNQFFMFRTHSEKI